MLIGAHVSTAGGLHTAIERATAMGCEAVQIVNQSPRVWRPNTYVESDYAEFHAALAVSPVQEVAIHTSYLINPATRDSSIRSKSLASLAHAVQLGDRLGAVGVVAHPGAQKGEPVDECLRRAGQLIQEALDESEGCPILIEHMSGYHGILGRSFDQLARIVDHAGGDERLGICIDTCHLYVQGYDVTRPDGLSAVLDEIDAKLGLERLRCLHLNDANDPLGSRQDRHANIGEGQMGDGLRTVLAEPRLERVPALLETPGPAKKGPDAEQVRRALALRDEVPPEAGDGDERSVGRLNGQPHTRDRRNGRPQERGRHDGQSPSRRRRSALHQWLARKAKTARAPDPETGGTPG